MYVNDWIEHASATALVATATKAGQADRRHVAARVLAGYSDATQTGTLTITRGSDTIVQPLTGDVYLELDLRGGLGEAISAALSAGGAGVVGYVTIVGRTE